MLRRIRKRLSRFRGEKYTGRKFRTVFTGYDAPEDTRIFEVIDWMLRFGRLGLLPREGGNIGGNFSFRNKEGFIITAGGVNKRRMTNDDFVQVLRCNPEEAVVKAIGLREPSSETFMHHMIYRKRRDAGAVIHVHDHLAMEHADKLGVPVTGHELPYGETSSAEKIIKAMEDSDYVVMKGHGVLSVGKSVWEAANRIIAYHEDAKKLVKKEE